MKEKVITRVITIITRNLLETWEVKFYVCVRKRLVLV